MFYNGGKLYSYSLETDDLLVYDPENGRWLGERYQEIRPVQQHSRLAIGDTLLLFGGYGYHTFKSQLAGHLFSGGGWNIETTDQIISPRYLSAMGYAGDGEIYLLGGYGTFAGRQEDSPRSFHDLYKIDLRTGEIIKVAELDPSDEPVAFGNGLVIDRPGGMLYALAFNNTRYNTEIILLGVDPETGDAASLSEPVPYRFRDTESYSDLFISQDSTMLYAVLLNSHHHGVQDAEIYTLSYPPLQPGTVIRQSVSKNRSGVWGGVLPAAAVVLIVVIAFLRKRKKPVPPYAGEVAPVRDTGTGAEVVPAESKPVSRITLLGGFQVIDSTGKDITGQFTPVVRQVFLLILLHSTKGGKGISSQLLDNTLWFGMDRGSASNNRSVNIRRLRKLLPQVGAINVTHENSYWNIEITGDVFCDYLEIANLINSARKSREIAAGDLDKILEIGSAGPMLPNQNAEWADQFKSSYTQSLTDLLLRAAAQPEIKTHSSSMLKIADVILALDSTDEDAIRIKCRTLYALGQKGAAKNCFTRYAAEYERLLDEPPDFSFEEIIG